MALTCIDVLSKFAVATPLEYKDAPTVTDIMPDIFRRMGGKPKIIYSDDEGVLRGDLFKEYVEKEGIQLRRTRSSAHFVERFNRTLKDMLFKRIENDEKKGKANIQWVDYLSDVILVYNDKMVHSATGMTPRKAREKENEFKAKVNAAMKAKKNRLYPELEIGSKVKIMRKKERVRRKNQVIG